MTNSTLIDYTLLDEISHADYLNYRYSKTLQAALKSLKKIWRVDKLSARQVGVIKSDLTVCHQLPRLGRSLSLTDVRS
jgi:hypothetical protein